MTFRRRAWDIAERDATPEHMFLSRRDLLATAGLGAGLVLSPAGLGSALAAGGTPAPRNDRYTLDRPITPEEVSGSYNNFYEFGSQKTIFDAAQALKTEPWTVTFDGMVETERKVDAADLIKAMAIEERLYRHRCVEAWSMAVPWTGFAMADLVAYAKPLAGAKYVRMETFLDPDTAPGQRQVWYPWPYVEGLTMAEATNELAFIVTGAYGKPLPNQFGAPIRLAVPWKYGFKSIKSIVRFTFTDERPKTFWEGIQASEYGFWANVNPEVPHPRWSQASERVLHTGEQVPTLLYNGYAEQVAGLYTGLEGERLFM
ncbi:protein-methionine-sulfoxide reductase catalytic subunit MsrP [Methylobrevis pamukkalensis]|uniref:Protein-methionine-sulfoxide reductase catalytic subunit MsrP n=1 Tax=Methylobrevis pamukkalensis TaxID=1439726 RepID=A0A1E3GX25_9HYPH|nr:protein-methionine-sulfoxide reductase catalytic subunit MsrP [Methylobrevis pamukkalensis]ODN68590.1 Sulfoxide reductase catalytic subunit YedY precursor [Methylobrevis pamukkalensis]